MEQILPAPALSAMPPGSDGVPALRDVDKAMMASARRLLTDRCGAVLVETAICLPIVITMLLGMLTYGQYFMAAHSLQQAANEASRAAIAAINEADRSRIVDESITKSVVGGGVYDQSLVRVQKRSQAPYYTVTVTYDIAKTGLPAASIIPLPSGQIVRSSTVKLVDL